MCLFGLSSDKGVCEPLIHYQMESQICLSVCVCVCACARTIILPSGYFMRQYEAQ